MVALVKAISTIKLSRKVLEGEPISGYLVTAVNNGARVLPKPKLLKQLKPIDPLRLSVKSSVDMKPAFQLNYKDKTSVLMETSENPFKSIGKLDFKS